MKTIIYLNGKYVRVDESSFEKLLPGALDGKGAFETMRLYNGKIFVFKEHMIRLRRGLKHFHLTLPISEKDILKIVAGLIRRNQLKNARVRVIIWRHVTNNISISLQQLKLPTANKYKDGFKVVTAKNVHDRLGDSYVKSIDYKMFRKAFSEAHQKGFDEAILLNSKAEVVEGTRTNIFFVKNGKLFTPAITCGCLNGITRQQVIICARKLKVPVKFVAITLNQLLQADEAFLTGSTLEVMPIKSINRKNIGQDRPGKITSLLMQTYKKEVRNSLFGKNIV